MSIPSTSVDVHRHLSTSIDFHPHAIAKGQPMSIFSFLIVKPASWIAGRFGGAAAATAVAAEVQSVIDSEIAAKKPAILTAIDGAVAAISGVAATEIAYVRGRIVSTVESLALSSGATSVVVSAIQSVAAPVVSNVIGAIENVAAPAVEAEASSLIARFAASVKAAVEAL
jgi:hypothetical protein